MANQANRKFNATQSGSSSLVSAHEKPLPRLGIPDVPQLHSVPNEATACELDSRTAVRSFDQVPVLVDP